jgi:hypothetical protein
MRFVTKCLLVTFFVLCLLCLRACARNCLLLLWLSGRFRAMASHILPPTFSVHWRRLPVLQLHQNYDIPPISNSPSTPCLSHGPSSSETSFRHLLGGQENHPVLLCNQPTVVSVGVNMLKLPRRCVMCESPRCNANRLAALTLCA